MENEMKTEKEIKKYIGIEIEREREKLSFST